MDMIGMGKKENIVLQCEMFVKCMLLYQEHLLSLCFVITWCNWYNDKLLVLLHDNIFLTLQQHTSESHGYKCCNYYAEKKKQKLKA